MRAIGSEPLRLLVGGFVALITIGAIVLALPAATPAHQPLTLVDAVFTATSAACVTGLVVRLSTGVTEQLSPTARLLVAGLMFVGRLGPLTVAAALSRDASPRDWRYPEEEVMVG